uniref:Uncharacterized protein LOC111115606 n=1 Tax=Crassostrea virginica TaxID=6565 RepID=A0A8B8C353_CRAVI|nr:uncharacterized protein LOC111115606 [Crassostrea virginica]
MYSLKSFIKAFRTFSTKLNDDGLCFSRCYRLSKSVVMLCLTLTLCLGEDVKSVNGCVGNYIFIKSMNKCIECPDGSFGPGCAPCLPKKYGRFCASTCYCSVELCNAVTGCSEEKTINFRYEEQSTTPEITTQNLSTLILSPNTSSRPMARKTVENKHRTLLLITVAGTTTNNRNQKRDNTSEYTDKSHSSLKNTASVLMAVTDTFISTLFLVATGFQIRSRIILCRQETSHQQNMFCENGNIYAEGQM